MVSRHALGRGDWLPSMHWEEGCQHPEAGVGSAPRGSASMRGLHPWGYAYRGDLGRGLRCMGYYGIQSTIVLYASYWNAFWLILSGQCYSKAKLQQMSYFSLTSITHTEFRYTLTNIIRLKFKQNSNEFSESIRTYI